MNILTVTVILLHSLTGDEGSTVSVTLTGSTEANWDFIDIYNGAGTLLESLTGSYGTVVVFSDDNGITIQFDSDSSVSWIHVFLDGSLC